MLLSLRSNPQTMSPYIHKSDSLCTRTDYHMLLPIVLHMVVPLCRNSNNLTIWRLSFVLKKGQMTILWIINKVHIQILRPSYLH